MTANVALVGALQSGKDSVAAYLIAEKGYTRFSFADALKHEVCRVLNSVMPYVPDEPGAAWTRERVEKHKEFLRPFLQWYGTEYRRAQDDLYWVRGTLAAIDRWPGRHGGPEMPGEVHRDLSLVFTDARFTNELIAAQGLGCKIIELNMATEEVVERLLAKGSTTQEIGHKLSHPSEHEWRSFPKDAGFRSTAGNLPVLATKVLYFLVEGGMPPLDLRPQRSAVEFFHKLYPHLYPPADLTDELDGDQAPKKRSHKKKAT